MLPAWAIVVIVIGLILLIGGSIMLGIYIKMKHNRERQQARQQLTCEQPQKNNNNNEMYNKIHQYYRKKLHSIMNRSQMQYQSDSISPSQNTTNVQNTFLLNGVKKQHQIESNIPITNVQQQRQDVPQQRNILKNSSFLTSQSQIQNKPIRQSKLSICQNNFSPNSNIVTKKTPSSETKVLEDDIEEQNSLFSKTDQKMVSFSIEAPKQLIPISPSKENINDTSITTYGHVLATSQLTDDNFTPNLKEEGLLLRQCSKIPMKKINQSTDISSGISLDLSQKRQNNLSSSSANHSMSLQDQSFNTSNFKTYKTQHIIFTQEDDVQSNLSRALTQSVKKQHKEIAYKPYVQEPFHNSHSQLLRSVLAQNHGSYGHKMLRPQQSIDHISFLYDH